MNLVEYFHWDLSGKSIVLSLEVLSHQHGNFEWTLRLRNVEVSRFLKYMWSPVLFPSHRAWGRWTNYPKVVECFSYWGLFWKLWLQHMRGRSLYISIHFELRMLKITIVQAWIGKRDLSLIWSWWCKKAVGMNCLSLP